MNFRRALALAATLFLATGPVMAQEPVWHGGVTTIGELKYKDGFTPLRLRQSGCAEGRRTETFGNRNL